MRGSSYLSIAMVTVLVGFIHVGLLHADVVSDGLRSWEPTWIQGTLMDIKGGTCVVAEKQVLFLDTLYKGKQVKTRVLDTGGDEIPKERLRPGCIVLVKGGRAWDESRNGPVILATQIQILKKYIDVSDEEQRRKYLQPEELW